MRAFMVFFIFSCSCSARCAIRISLSDTCVQSTRGTWHADKRNYAEPAPERARGTQQVSQLTLVAQDAV